MKDLDDLAARARGGDGAALTALIEGIQDDVFRLSLRMLWHPQDAEDAAQEILFKVVTSISTFRGESSFRTWALRVASNHLLNVRRSRIEEQRLTFESFGRDLADGLREPSASQTFDADHHLLEEEVKVGCTQAMLLCLTREERLAYILGDVFELRSDDAAIVLDIAPAAFRKRLSRARERVRAFMVDHCGLVSEHAACRCGRRIAPAIERGRVDPKHLLFAGRGAPALRGLPVLEAVGEMERLHEIAAIHRSHGQARAPERLAAAVRRVMRALLLCALALATASTVAQSQGFIGPDGKLRVLLAQQPFSPNGRSAGPRRMATGGIQQYLAAQGAHVRIEEAALTAQQDKEYGGWKRLGMALGHFADIVERNERDGYFTVGLLATCPSMPGLVAGLQRSGSAGRPLRVGMLWLDAHPDFNTPETTRSGSLGGMPVAVATGRALHRMRLDAKLDPPLADSQVVMGGVRLTDPLEQELLDASAIQQVSVDDLRRATPAVFAQLDRLSRTTDKIYVHIDMDVLDPREVEGHQNKVPNGPSSEELARLFEMIFSRYPKASAIGFATIPATDEGGLSLAAVNRMIEGALRGVSARDARR